MSKTKAPWLNNYGDVPHNLKYFEGSLYDAIKLCAEKYKSFTAYDFMGKKTSYGIFLKKVDKCARALANAGIKCGDRVTIAMPNCPQTVVMFYALNKIGAISNMVHPLSSENEIKFFINESKSVCALTLDQFYYKFEAIKHKCCVKTIIVASIKDELLPHLKLGYTITNKKYDIPYSSNVISYKQFIKNADTKDLKPNSFKKDDTAVILYSGGTTGTTKGILLSNFNFNALGEQIIATNPMFCAGDSMLAVMPMFHGFGLGVSIHSMLMNGGRCVLVPRFTPKSYAKLIKKHKCNFIAGVPTLYQALICQSAIKNVDLSCLKGVFSGGDSLSVELKTKFDAFLKEHNAKVEIREGYGTTECVTASCLTPIHLAKKGSIGQPFPDMFYKICEVGTTTEVEYGVMGEICISGPTIMIGYMDRPDETADTLKTHNDGRVWLHTGDLGTMDSDGFVYFKQRLKRVIVTSGYNVYPSQLENILDAHKFIEMSCVIGVPDKIKMQKIKAFVMLAKGVEKSESTKHEILEYCKKNIAKYALPYDIEFRDELPKTLVGKVAYRVLEQEELNKLNKTH